MNSRDLRKKFQDYFTARGHRWIKSSSLIPKGDPSLLFTNAGMNRFKGCFTGAETPPHPQVGSIQKCLRAGGKHNDLEQVGHSLFHHTFFEMMGNFSFGSYFKKEAMDFALSFLTKEIGLSQKRLWVSVFKDDRESFTIWNKGHNFPKEKIFILGEKDNFWRMGDTGPCGPCSEIYYYDGPKKNPEPEDMAEIWNLVFMEFNEVIKAGKKNREPLPAPCVDTGMGLERLTAVLQGEKSNYHTDLFKDIIQAVERSAGGAKYDFTGEEKIPEEIQTAFRVTADHSRAVAFLISDGILPGSEGASYVLRRILRRAFFYSHKISTDKNLLSTATKKVIELMSPFYPELNTSAKIIQSAILEEKALFTHSLKEGQNVFLKKIKNVSRKNVSEKNIPNEVVWDLYSTYGFPPDLTRLIAKEQGLTVDKDFSLEHFKTSSIGAEQKQSKFTYLKEFIQQLNPKDYPLLPATKKETPFTGYTKTKETARIICPIQLKNDTQELWVITDKTCFYPEGGGPVGDQGTIETPTGKAQVTDCQKIGPVILHKIKMLNGELKAGQDCTMEVDLELRRLIATAHSATHLLNQALRVILGSTVRQMGSLVEPGALRFDFSHPRPLTKEQITKIENQVKGYIKAGHTVSDSISSYQSAVAEGVVRLAGENYGEQVRTIRMGQSFELCGGIHVKNTADIGDFKIIAETGVQSGVRRIMAYTSDILQTWSTLLAEQSRALAQELNVSLLQKPTSQGPTSQGPTSQKPTLQKPEQNPFIDWLKEKDAQKKELKTQLKRVLFADKKTSSSIPPTGGKTPPEVYDPQETGALKPSATDHTPLPSDEVLAQQNKELREYLKLPLPKLAPAEKQEVKKDIKQAVKKDAKKDTKILPVKSFTIKQQLTEKENPFILLMQKKQQEIKKLKRQIAGLSSALPTEEIINQARPFKRKNIKGLVLTAILPVEDRNILAEATDRLKSKAQGQAVVALLGEGGEKNSYPIVVAVSRGLQQEVSAGDILQNTLAPRWGGKGGGQARFAQGTVANKPDLTEMQNILWELLQSKK